MYNPSGLDTNHEWVEIYNNDNGTYNLTGWKLRTDDTDHSFNQNGTNLILPSGAFAVIVQDTGTFLSDYSNTSNITVIDSSWLDLTNTVNKSIIIKNSSVVFGNITYSVVAEGNTSCIINSSFIACIPTPGAANMLNVTNATNVTDSRSADVFITVVEKAYVNSTYTLFSINISGKDCNRLDNITLSYNITPPFVNSSLMAEIACNASLANWTPTSSANYTVCGFAANTSFTDTNTSNNAACKTVSVTELQKRCNTSVSILSDSVVNSTNTLEYKLILSDGMCNETAVDVEYWIEDLFGAYVKAKLNTTQEFSCSKTVDRQWTPDAVVGIEAYRIKAVLKTKCSDISNSDNSAEKIVVVRGSQAAASLAPSSSSSSSVPSSTRNSSVALPKPESADIVSYPPSVFVDEPFEVIVNVSLNGSFSIYSYVYSGNTPVSRSLDGKGAWDANKKEINLTGSTLVSLVKKVENGTAPGIYSMRVKIKGSVEKEITKTINVVERPSMEVKTYNTSFTASTSCESCEIMVVGPDAEIFSKKQYTAENVSGMFRIFLILDSKIFSKRVVNISAVTIENRAVSRTAPVTSFVAKKNADMKKYIFLIRLLSKIRLF